MRRTVLLLAAVLIVAFAGNALAGSSKKTTNSSWTTVASPAAYTKAQASQGGIPSPERQYNASLRVAGKDRFETAAVVSQAVWTPEATAVVFLANGQNFPDALAIGPSTFLGGPLLLVGKDFLPAPTAQELARLEPCGIVVVGGRATVSDEVVQQADQYARPDLCTESP